MCVLEDKPSTGKRVCEDVLFTSSDFRRWAHFIITAAVNNRLLCRQSHLFHFLKFRQSLLSLRLSWMYKYLSPCARWMRNKSLCDLGPSLRWETPNAGGGDGCDEVNSGELDAMRWGWIGWRRAATILPWNDRQQMDAWGEGELWVKER